ncbi:MAG: iron ABC transporter ATP-binding protein [Sulfurimonas sp. RIFOXYD12_FULL_33_39]|uniref:ATP-binding cassette domain-containing protein n=1 Tax=unclassified Sulfurimonas TaxID=2623549 RepID=UPI0008AABD14|nr:MULTISPECIES: ATP-binding cassette domain-containing protein [unclassified Sulfurimonas]OHE07598.1 MAG: iron ABC transporter ATP-binding protein [Sulfurimonas sp. RIFCSPLOWO2_12_FULL_34_6]OHE10786.1 MAG: iron ABC transporter ATP-binding protein [Sulfurimonas sp. RIFOXYD12_FULL_33_39]OHE13444.1 MAG: iron ABC transporter ATP-binding protein [Sulfurimonas sp. RIFOXYD2_FULL_34_21]
MLHVDNFSNNILTNISFDLQTDENLIILGSNGAGKSTLAKVLCGITHSESVSLFEKKLHLLDASKRAEVVNYVPPKLDIFDEYISLREYLELSRLHSKLTIDEVLELLELKELKNKACITLSSGEQQLTLLASSLLHNAKLTIFDEPTANLDPKKMLKVAKILSGEKIQNRIIITHDLNLAHKLGYKILYMLDGKIEFFDENKKFFQDSNMNKFFGTSIKRLDNYFVANL